MPALSSNEKNRALQLKAEVVAAELLGSQATHSDKLRYVAKGSFKKNFRNDIDAIAIDENGFIELSVNRDGIYDRLPEGIFHQTRMQKNSHLSEMVAEHKRYKVEEKSARLFFRPFEQEFFRYSVLIEQEEHQRTLRLYDGNMLQQLKEFWLLDDALPTEPLARLIQMMPWADTIKGNLSLTTKTLELILGTTVRGEEQIREASIITDDVAGLGEMVLGTNSTMGNKVSSTMLCWIFTLSQLSANAVFDFTPHQPFALLLQKFVDIFIPLEIDVLFDYETSSDDTAVLNPVLGYNFTL